MATPLRTAAQLKLTNLYHYQSFNVDYLREVIVDGVIYFSKPSDFNDPWDCRPWFDFSGLADPEIVEEHVRWYIDVTKRNRPDISEDQVLETANLYRKNPNILAQKVREFSGAMCSAIDSRYRVYCLSSRCDSELMWSHYADKHRGVCLEFEVLNDLFFTALQVQYAEVYPRFSMTSFSGDEQQIAPLITKSNSWGYEKEFRLISDELGDPRDCIVTVGGKKGLPALSLTGVVLGCLAPDSTKTAIQGLIAASTNRPQLKSAQRALGRYQLTIA
jgi:hypothetical protein